MPGRVVAFLLAFLWAVPVCAQSLPELTGRVVDSADMLSAHTEDVLNGLLEAHEKQNSNQVVVVTVPDLKGESIEDFGNRLGRYWGIGQAGRDNGVLLIVAPNERKVRIEVGYGLEGALPDALAHRIVQDEVLPSFRDNQMDDGVLAGTRAILLAIEGEYEPVTSWNPVPAVNVEEILVLAVIVLILGIVVIDHVRNEGWNSGGGYSGGGYSGGRRRGHDHDDLFDDDHGHYRPRRRRSRPGGGRRSSGSRGGFSGGGGGFGGGGASGGW